MIKISFTLNGKSDGIDIDEIVKGAVNTITKKAQVKTVKTIVSGPEIGISDVDGIADILNVETGDAELELCIDDAEDGRDVYSYEFIFNLTESES